MNVYTKEEIENAIDARLSGMRWVEIGEMLGTSPESARSSIRRRLSGEITGANFTDWREKVGDMKPMEAVRYLSDIIEIGLPYLANSGHEIDTWGLKLTKMERRLLIMLYDRSPNLVTRSNIMPALYADRTDKETPEDKIIAVFVSKIRKKIPPERGVIVPVFGRGYRFEPPVKQ